MDPVAIIGAASSLVVSLAKASKSLSDIRKGFHEAPMTLASMITECKTISAALTHLQNLTLGNPVALSPSIMSPETITESFDNALTGCMLILSALEAQLERFSQNEKPEDIRFMQRVRLLWNEDTMSQLLENLRGQHAAINTLVSLFQTMYVHIRVGDQVYNPEQESEHKGRRIAKLLDNIASLQIQATDLDRRLQVATAKISHFSAYHKSFKQTGAECVQQIQHERDQIKELEERLSSLRKSHGSKILSHLIEFHELWNEPGHIAPTSSSRSPFVEPSASSRPVQAEDLPKQDTGSQESTLVDSDDLIVMSE
ncbi:ankyrin repeat [Trichoderma arundinaceum]|uniref:Ankyrin repeat n=1 Tax=Trichoderma arundinaceum TaxID=490622 RepID=A0A395NLQ3_TRIAR|nr:ankyrin repeat [Trichoderma arundinaceum]